MTKLTTYTVTFRTEHDTATEDITAASPQAALAEAHAIADDQDRLACLDFEPYSEHVPVDEIVVETPDDERVAEWLSPDLLLRLAAADRTRGVPRLRHHRQPRRQGAQARHPPHGLPQARWIGAAFLLRRASAPPERRISPACSSAISHLFPSRDW